MVTEYINKEGDSMANLSNFPDEVDTFRVFSDIQASDIDNKKELEELLNMTASEREDYPLWQDRVNELRVLLKDKMPTADDLMKIQDAITNIQEYLLLVASFVDMEEGEEQ